MRLIYGEKRQRARNWLITTPPLGFDRDMPPVATQDFKAETLSAGLGLGRLLNQVVILGFNNTQRAHEYDRLRHRLKQGYRRH